MRAVSTRGPAETARAIVLDKDDAVVAKLAETTVRNRASRRIRPKTLHRSGVLSWANVDAWTPNPRTHLRCRPPGMSGEAPAQEAWPLMATKSRCSRATSIDRCWKSFTWHSPRHCGYAGRTSRATACPTVPRHTVETLAPDERIADRGSSEVEPLMTPIYEADFGFGSPLCCHEVGLWSWRRLYAKLVTS